RDDLVTGVQTCALPIWAARIVPLQRRRLPRITRRFLAPDPRPDEIDRKWNLRQPQHKRADRDELIHRLEMLKHPDVGVTGIAPRKPADTQDMHGEKREI